MSRLVRSSGALSYVAIAAIGLVLAALPAAFGGSPFYLRLFTQMLLFMTYTVAFNMIFGSTRQLFLCVGALAGSGAYVSVVATTQLHASPWITVPAGAVVAAALGALFSYVTVRRRLGLIFVGIVTLAFSLAFDDLLLGLRQYTQGETGIVTSGLGLGLVEDPRSGYAVFLGLLVASLVLYRALSASRVGTAFRALRDDELTAELSGVDVALYKVLAATIGSAILGLAGALYAYDNHFVSPSVFAFDAVDVVVLTMLLLGGLSSLFGPVIGGAVFTVVNELVRPLGPLNVMVYGIFLVVLFLFRDAAVAAVRRALRLTILAPSHE
jgi:branched-chain amino acid transport system permease protein